jgi:hypothetical protein
MRDFMGLNVHTVLFKPELYRPVTRLVRDYHGFDWDVGADTDYTPRFPFARNGVNWEQLYGDWKKAGYTTSVSLMFGQTQPGAWKNLPHDAEAYGHAFARFFGPSGPRKLVESLEIGNEPGHYSDAEYRALFESMARGARRGDPRLTIATCAITTGASEKYAKSVECVKGLEALYDVLNLHTYAFAEQYPTWRRSFPEDPNIAFLKPIRDTISWRNTHAPGKQIWVTEFGWDASTKPPPAAGDFARWTDVTDEQQAQYLVRAFLLFATLDVDRAYNFFFNDSDEPQLHGSSGLTRNFVPKPAFHAVAHLHRALGDYRLSRVVAGQPGALFLHEYQHTTVKDRRVWVAWSPTGSSRSADTLLPAPRARIVRAEQMPLAPGPAPRPAWKVVKDGSIKITVSESPTYFWLEAQPRSVLGPCLVPVKRRTQGVAGRPATKTRPSASRR